MWNVFKHIQAKLHLIAPNSTITYAFVVTQNGYWLDLICFEIKTEGGHACIYETLISKHLYRPKYSL